jgi:hypothetical protein
MFLPHTPLFADQWQQNGKAFTAVIQDGMLISLKGRDGRQWLITPQEPIEQAVGIELDTPENDWAGSSEPVDGGQRFDHFSDKIQAVIDNRYRFDDQSGDLVVTQAAQASHGHLKAVSWSLGYVPLDMQVIVPHNGGRVVRPQDVDRIETINYPFGLEAQLIIFEKDGHGFYLWSDDPNFHFKQIELIKTSHGWLVRMTAKAQAPWDQTKILKSQRWRINTFDQTWRQPARRYRQWAAEAFDNQTLEDRTPTWARDIRCILYSSLKIPPIQTLAKTLDPRQTMIYLLKWRKQEFDRGYPDYDQDARGLMEFVTEAHRLGYRVMLHTNFFQLDYSDPLFKELGDKQILKEDGTLAGWNNTRHNPPIQSAYINPASKRWREEMVTRLTRLVERTGADAIHLDQNFHVYNDLHGPIDGMNMPQGVVALHRDLRHAMPEIALGGEGLNELTFPYLSFAQRHVFALMRKAIDRDQLKDAHPISSYLFSDSVNAYGWPGMASPAEDGQRYAAWWEEYRNWATIPTIKILRQTPEILEHPTGFLRLALDEAVFMQQHRVNAAPDAHWPDSATFPFVTAKGEPVLRTKDRQLVFNNNQVISRMITGVQKVTMPGRIDHWLLRQGDTSYGLDPNMWYPCFTGMTEHNDFGITVMPEQFTVRYWVKRDGLIILDTARREAVPGDVVAQQVSMQLVSDEPICMALHGDTTTLQQRDDRHYDLRSVMPGRLFLLTDQPMRVSASTSLLSLKHEVIFRNEQGGELVTSPAAWVKSISEGWKIHPPDRGMAEIHMPMILPDEPVTFSPVVQVENGKPDHGFQTSIAINGIVVAQQNVMPDHPMSPTMDLSAWRGKPVVLSFSVSYDGLYAADWVRVSSLQLQSDIEQGSPEK